MKRILITGLFATFLSSLSLWAQQQPAVLTLSQAVDAAFTQGADSRILQRNLDIGRQQYRVSVSQNSFSLAGSLGESATYGFGDSTMLLENSIGSGLGQTPQAGLSLTNPLTSVGLSVTPYTAASPFTTELSQLSSIFTPGQTAPSPGPTGSLTLNISQTVWGGYPGGPGKAAAEKSLLALRGMELSAESTRLRIANAVTQAYFIMLGSQRDLSAKKEILGQQNALLAQISAIQAFKQATEIDLRTAQINAQSAEIDVQSAQNDLRIARIRLAQLIGWSRDRDFSVEEQDDPQLAVGSVEDAVAEALKRRPDIRQIELNRQSSAIDRALIQGQTSPTVSVTGGANVIHDWQLLTTAGQGSVGLKIGLPILDAGAAGAQLEANRLQTEVYGVQEEQLRASIATDVEEAYEQVQVNVQRVQVARLTAEKFDLKFKLRKMEAQYGSATNQDLLDASIDAANAQSALVRAQRDAQLAILQLRNAMGY
jgi:outer membrane protein TolC